MKTVVRTALCLVAIVGTATAQPLPGVEVGRVDATEIPDVPKPFGMREPGFSYRMRPLFRYAKTSVHHVRFRAAGMDDDVRAIYYRPDGDGPFPGVVTIHGLLKSQPSFADFIAQRLAVRGVATLMVEMAGYGERVAVDRAGRQWSWLLEPDTAQRFLQQAVRDIRRGATWLAQREEVDADRLGITGVSMGGIFSSLAMSLDPRFKRGVFFLAGGRIEQPLFDARELTWVKARYRAIGLDREAVRERLRGYEPVEHAHRLRGRPVLFINAAFDTLITPDMTKALHEAAGGPPIVWIPGGHYTALAWLPWVAARTADHFTQPKASPTPPAPAPGR